MSATAKLKPVTDTVRDMGVHKGKQALGRLADNLKRTREDWREYGAVLLAQRDITPSAPIFGRWVRANGLDAYPAGTPQVRADAIWMAENWDQVQEFYFRPRTKEDVNPTQVRQSVRNNKVGIVWTLEEKKARKAERVEQAAEDKAHRLAQDAADEARQQARREKRAAEIERDGEQFHTAQWLLTNLEKLDPARLNRPQEFVAAVLIQLERFKP